MTIVTPPASAMVEDHFTQGNKRSGAAGPDANLDRRARTGVRAERALGGRSMVGVRNGGHRREPLATHVGTVADRRARRGEPQQQVIDLRALRIRTKPAHTGDGIARDDREPRRVVVDQRELRTEGALEIRVDVRGPPPSKTSSVYSQSTPAATLARIARDRPSAVGRQLPSSSTTRSAEPGGNQKPRASRS